MGAVLQEQIAPAWVTHRVTSPVSKPALAWTPLSMGPQVLPGACSSTDSPWGHTLHQAPTCSGVGPLPQATGGYLLHHGPPWISGEKPASSWSSSRAASENSLLRCLEHLLPLLLYSLWCLQSCFSHMVSLLSLDCPFTTGFFPLLKCVITETLPPLLMIGLALANRGFVLELADIGFIRHGGSYLQLLTEATPIAPPATKTLSHIAAIQCVFTVRKSKNHKYLEAINHGFI